MTQSIRHAGEGKFPAAIPSMTPHVSRELVTIDDNAPRWEEHKIFDLGDTLAKKVDEVDEYSQKRGRRMTHHVLLLPTGEEVKVDWLTLIHDGAGRTAKKAQIESTSAISILRKVDQGEIDWPTALRQLQALGRLE